MVASSAGKSCSRLLCSGHDHEIGVRKFHERGGNTGRLVPRSIVVMSRRSHSSMWTFCAGLSTRELSFSRKGASTDINNGREACRPIELSGHRTPQCPAQGLSRLRWTTAPTFECFGHTWQLSWPVSPELGRQAWNRSKNALPNLMLCSFGYCSFIQVTRASSISSDCVAAGGVLRAPLAEDGGGFLRRLPRRQPHCPEHGQAPESLSRLGRL